MIASHPIASLPISGALRVGEYDVSTTAPSPTIAFRIGFELTIATLTPVPSVEMTATFPTYYHIAAETPIPDVDATAITGRGFELTVTTPQPDIEATGVFGRAFSFTASTSAALLTMSILRSGALDVAATSPLPSLLWTYAAVPAPAIPPGTTTSSTTAWCVNMVTGGHTRYTDFPDASGVSLINAEVVTGVMDFGKPSAKRIHDLYAHCRVSNGDMTLDTITDEHITVAGYELETRGTVGLIRRRVRLAKGVRGMNWQFILKNLSGCDFELQSVEVDPVVSERHK